MSWILDVKNLPVSAKACKKLAELSSGLAAGTSKIKVNQTQSYKADGAPCIGTNHRMSGNPERNYEFHRSAGIDETRTTERKTSTAASGSSGRNSPNPNLAGTSPGVGSSSFGARQVIISESGAQGTSEHIDLFI